MKGKDELRGKLAFPFHGFWLGRKPLADLRGRWEKADPVGMKNKKYMSHACVMRDKASEGGSHLAWNLTNDGCGSKLKQTDVGII